MRNSIKTALAPRSIGPYSQGIRTRDFVFVSGQLPVDPNNNEIPEGIANQTERSLRNVQAVLKSADCTMNDVVEVLIFLKNMNDFAAMNQVYEQFFEVPYPSRAVVEVAGLPLDVLVEIKATAIADCRVTHQTASLR
ncbi:RidA/YER057c/UK114 superfamily protein [Olavius algarvensis spirochete endosymbiont]|uniref:Rid family detoxifying hydrolase n=1 Tax=Olavius algarvensis spirochete endosymbiont TaxID=260710 RepID=UPI0006918C0F|nr:Rid family detoxifying hydrolase [Olavius algarvensis spirochete endosymbiont]VDA99470.1 RidA/YER057c/UK114 superfamily protein [Olavius algarvensis spirochete endosymbiont]